MRELALALERPAPPRLAHSGLAIEGLALVARTPAGRVEHALSEVDSVTLSRRHTARVANVALWLSPALCLLPGFFAMGPLTIALIAAGVMAGLVIARRPQFELVVRARGTRHRYPVHEAADQAEAFAFECAGIVGGGLGAPGAYHDELQRIADYQLEVGKNR